MLSYSDAIQDILIHYEQAGFQLWVRTPGQGISDEFKVNIHDEHLGALYAFVDELIFLLRYVSYYFMSAMACKEERASAFFYRLALNMLTTLASIRTLCGFGLDTSARMQLRLLYETAILLCRFTFDDEACEEFENCHTPEAANQFWRRYLAKSKSEKYIRQKVADRSANWFGNIDNGRTLAGAQINMGLATHPSLINIMFDVVQDIGNPSDGAIVIGPTRIGSHFTLATAVLITTLPFSFTPEQAYGLKTMDMLERGPMIPANHKAGSWEEYCRIIRLMPLSLFFVSVKYSNGLRPTEQEITSAFSGFFGLRKSPT